jgi:hypothetical protein
MQPVTNLNLLGLDDNYQEHEVEAIKGSSYQPISSEMVGINAYFVAIMDDDANRFTGFDKHMMTAHGMVRMSDIANKFAAGQFQSVEPEVFSRLAEGIVMWWTNIQGGTIKELTEKLVSAIDRQATQILQTSSRVDWTEIRPLGCSITGLSDLLRAASAFR